MPYEIHANHRDDNSLILTRENYISAFEGASGDGWTLSINRKSFEGLIDSNDIEEPVFISFDDPAGGLTLEPAEQQWLISCWMSLLQTASEQIQARILLADANRQNGIPIHG